MVLHQFAADLRQKIRPVNGIPVGNEIDGSKDWTVFIANAAVKLPGVFEQLDADSPRRQAFFGGKRDDTSFGIHKLQFCKFVEIVHLCHQQL